MSANADLFPEVATVAITGSAIGTHRDQHVSIVAADNVVSVAALGVDRDGCDDEMWWAVFSPAQARALAADLVRSADMAESVP